MRCKSTGEIEQDLTKTKKIPLRKHLLYQKKKSRLFIIFPDYISIFHVWKITGQISRVFQEFKTLYEPWSYQIAFYAFHSFVVDVQSNAGYIRTKHAQRQPED